MPRIDRIVRSETRSTTPERQRRTALPGHSSRVEGAPGEASRAGVPGAGATTPGCARALPLPLLRRLPRRESLVDLEVAAVEDAKSSAVVGDRIAHARSGVGVDRSNDRPGKLVPRASMDQVVIFGVREFVRLALVQQLFERHQRRMEFAELRLAHHLGRAARHLRTSSPTRTSTSPSSFSASCRSGSMPRARAGRAGSNALERSPSFPGPA